MGIGKLQSPTKSIPLNRSTKIQHNWLRPRYKSTHSGLLGKWVKYDKNYFIYLLILSIIYYIYIFSDSPTGQTRWSIFTRHSSKDLKSRKDVPFEDLNDVPLNFGGKLPKTDFFGGVNKTFKPERQKIQILITWKLLSRSWRNYYREYAPRMSLRGWTHGSTPTNPWWRRPPFLISEKCQ